MVLISIMHVKVKNYRDPIGPNEGSLSLSIIIYFIIENQVFWARSEAVGYAVKRVEKNTELRRQNTLFDVGRSFFI